MVKSEIFKDREREINLTEANTALALNDLMEERSLKLVTESYTLASKVSKNYLKVTES